MKYRMWMQVTFQSLLGSESRRENSWKRGRNVRLKVFAFLPINNSGEIHDLRRKLFGAFFHDLVELSGNQLAKCRRFAVAKYDKRPQVQSIYEWG